MDRKRLDVLLGEGSRALAKGDYQKAQKSYQEVIEIDHSNVEAFFQLANLFHIQGKISKSIKAFKKVLELDPSHTDASISLSVLLNDIGKYQEAKDIFNRINDKVKSDNTTGVDDEHINRKFSQKHFELAEMYSVYNRYEEALSEYQRASKLDHENFEIRVKLAKLYSKRGYINKAIDELRKLKAEQPNYLPGKVALGLLLYGNGNVVEAQNEWMAVISKDPMNVEVKRYLELAQGATETRVF